MNELQVTVPPPGGGGQNAPPMQLKITPPQSKPEPHCVSSVQSVPQKLPVCPSVTKVRHEIVGAHSMPEVQVSQSRRPACVEQVPLSRLQNWFTGQNVLSRQKNWHCPLTHEFLGMQSPSSRHPARHESVEVLHTWLSGQCSSSVQGPLGMQRVVVVSQNVPIGQSRFDVQEANDWQ